MTNVFPLGEIPQSLGEMPKKMLAWCIRPDREGDPDTAMKLEEVDVPAVGPNEALVLVMAAGVNFNGVWAARGKPVSVFRMHGESFHIAGSDASGIVWKVGDEVVIHCNQSCGHERPRVRRPYWIGSMRVWALCFMLISAPCARILS